jgi:nitroreductase
MSDTNYDSLLELVKKRRSVRWFKPDSIPDEYIDKIIEVARWAPSGFHTQPWEFVVVKKKDIKDKIIISLRGEPALTSRRENYENAPVFIILLGDWRAKVGLPGSVEEQNRRVDNLFCSSLASAFLYMHLAATSLGLASAWVSASASDGPQRKIKEILKIPDALRIYDMMAVGYGSRSPITKVLRNKVDIIHYDDGGQYRTDAQVSADAEKTKEWCFSAH